MSDLLEIKSEVEEILHQIARDQDFTNYEIDFDVNAARRGDGFTGEFHLVSITNKDTNETLRLAVKKAFKNASKREETKLVLGYEAEVFFYSKVFPTLDKLQREKGISDPFVELPKYYYGTVELNKEAIVLDNLTAQGYVLSPVEDLLDDVHATVLFKLFGKFHALSMALKDQKIEEYRKLTVNAPDYISTGFRSENFQKLINDCARKAMNALGSDLQSNAMVQKLKKCATEELYKKMHYKGPHTTIAHADPWDKNRMFKYTADGKFEDIKLIDFQLVREACPVHDLSYIFYSAGSKELFGNLDHYLHLYHDSLSKTLNELGSDPEKLLPFEELKKDWTDYALYGFIIGLTATRVKLIAASEFDHITQDHEEAEDPSMMASLASISVNEEVYQKRVRDLIFHAHQIGLLL